LAPFGFGPLRGRKQFLGVFKSVSAFTTFFSPKGVVGKPPAEGERFLTEGLE